MRKFNSETKIKSKYRLHSMCNDLKSPKQSHLPEKQAKLPYSIQQYKKTAAKLLTEEQKDTPQTNYSMLNLERIQKPDIKLKINNIN